MRHQVDSLLAELPDTFRTSQAREHLSDRQLHRLVEDGSVVPLARGLYRKRDWLGDEDVVEVALRAPRATLCLRSALGHHGLIDDIPAEIDVAIPRGAWAPRSVAPIRWRRFDPATFDIGRETVPLDGGQAIGRYTAERSIVDAFRLQHLEGPELGREALRRWLRVGGQPSELLRLADSFPRTRTELRRDLEILL